MFARLFSEFNIGSRIVLLKANSGRYLLMSNYISKPTSFIGSSTNFSRS